MTAQKLANSSSSDCFQRFKHALVRAARSELIQRDCEYMANHQQQHQAMTRHQVWVDLKKGEGNGLITGEAVECDGRARPTKVEPDSQQRHLSAMGLASGKGMAAAMTTPLAIPVSPPSSPTHVSAQQEMARNIMNLGANMASAAASAAATATVPVAGSRSEARSRASQQSAVEVQQSPVGSGVPTAPAAVEIPLLSAISDGGEEGVDSNATAARAGPTLAPVRLGRGRKLCPNCKATTKSAVKQCRECNHVFSPASSRLRAPPPDPKENEDEPIPARRRLRPSQRLIEYELYEASTAVGDESNGQPIKPTRRTLGASNAGGDVNHHVGSSVSGGRLAVESSQASKTLASAGGANVRAQPPKRSHKRKVPLPPGVLPPKRKKGAAAARTAADAAAAAVAAASNREETAITETAHRLLPLTSLPERQRIAQDLVATHTTAVPMSPELIPAATPAGPLLFMPWSASTDDDPGWLSGPGAIMPVAVRLHHSVGLSSRMPLAQQPRASQTSVSPASPISSPLLVPSVEDLLMGEEEEEQARQSLPEPEGVNDALEESQTRDPFEGVQLWLEGARGGDNSVAGCFPAATETPSTVERGLLSNDVELLGDWAGDLMWSPLRTSSVNGSVGSLASSISNISLWSDSSGVSDPSRGSSDIAFPNFERGAALASAVPPACDSGDFGTELGRSESVGDLQGLLLGEYALESLGDGRRR